MIVGSSPANSSCKLLDIRTWKVLTSTYPLILSRFYFDCTNMVPPHYREVRKYTRMVRYWYGNGAIIVFARRVPVSCFLEELALGCSLWPNSLLHNERTVTLLLWICPSNSNVGNMIYRGTCSLQATMTFWFWGVLTIFQKDSVQLEKDPLSSIVRGHMSL